MNIVPFKNTIFHLKNGETRKYNLIGYNRKTKSFILDNDVIFTKNDIESFIVDGTECNFV